MLANGIRIGEHHLDGGLCQSQSCRNRSRGAGDEHTITIPHVLALFPNPINM